MKQMPSPTRRIGTQSSKRRSRRDHHSPDYQHPGHPYQHQMHQERYESVSSSNKKHKRRARPRSGSPYYHSSNPEHHRPRPRPHSTPNTMYS